MKIGKGQLAERLLSLSCFVFSEILITFEPEPRREKTGLQGFRPGPTQTGLYKLRKELEA